MPTGGSQNRAPPSLLPDLRRRPGWYPYTSLQDPVVTGAACSSSDPTTTAWYVTQLPTKQTSWLHPAHMAPADGVISILYTILE